MRVVTVLLWLVIVVQLAGIIALLDYIAGGAISAEVRYWLVDRRRWRK